MSEKVTVVGVNTVPYERALGKKVGAMFTRLLRENKVRPHTFHKGFRAVAFDWTPCVLAPSPHAVRLSSTTTRG